MSTELDMTQYLDLFIQEADEQLEVLEQELVKLEDDPSADRMSLIFRAAHTLKGSSRAMGFANVAGVTHEMESVLDRLRAGELTLSTAIADALLQCLDTLSEMKAAIAAGAGDAVDATELVAILQSFQGVAPSEDPAPVAAQPELPPAILDALKIAGQERPVFQASFRLKADCVMKFVRAFMAINIIQDGGELLASIPEVGLLEEEQFDLDFSLFFHHPDAVATLWNKFGSIAEVESYQVTPFEFAEDASAPASEVGASDGSTEPAPATNPSPAAPAKKSETGQTVRVDVRRLDELMNLVGELVIDRTRISQIGAALTARQDVDLNIQALAETVGHIGRITSDLQDQLMKARMLPIDTVFNRFPRVVRDLANKLGKNIKLDLVGGETELDRSVIEIIGDPLLHILRNSVDHGIEMPAARVAAGKPEAGTVRISARHHENHIVIDIIDDGNGIDVERVKKKAVSAGVISQDTSDRMTEREALQLIFSSGLSTAEQVTEVSGRGVGMDIVRSNIQQLGGLVDVETTLGEGSKFSLRLPLTLAIIRGLLVKVSGVVYVLPLGSVVETLIVSKSEIQKVRGKQVIVIRGVTTPVVRLRDRFMTRNFVAEPDNETMYVVVAGVADQRIGLVVDSLVGEQEVVIKSLNRFCGDVRGISGATILGNGNVALIVDVNGVLGEGWQS